MRLPFAPPLAPMLSSAADALPGGEGWQFEPKWDGFRTLVFRDGDEILLQSRDEKPMNRYFPELIAPLVAMLFERCVVDGEIVIVGVGGLDFETLLLRIHPAASRVKLLSAQAPAAFVAWDLLALGDDDLRNAPLAVRRERLEHVLAGAAPPVHLSPATRDRTLAADWFRRFEGAGLESLGLGRALGVPQGAPVPPGQPAAVDLLDNGCRPARRLHRQGAFCSGRRVRRQGGAARARSSLGGGGVSPRVDRRAARPPVRIRYPGPALRRSSPDAGRGRHCRMA